MNGIICIYKEQGMTSFDVVAQARRIFGTKKVGHGGTLDPMAEGVLPIFIGSATKAVDFCPDNTKQYLAGFKFGMTTDTQDITGKVLSQVNTYVSRNKMMMIERMFTGDLMQVPPMYSAVKVNGQKLYELARKGQVVDRKARHITVYELKIKEYEDNEGQMLVTCSKGTYIRTLIHDIGEKLGVGAVMTRLVRTKSGSFTIDDSYFLSDLEGKTPEELQALLMPLEKLYEQLPKAHLDQEQTRLFKNGARLDADRIRFDTIYDMGYYIEDCDGVFLGLGKIDNDHSLKVERRFNTKSQDDDNEENSAKESDSAEENGAADKDVSDKTEGNSNSGNENKNVNTNKNNSKENNLQENHSGGENGE